MANLDCDPLRVFIIEDDADARATLIDILELDNHLVRAVPTAAEALASDGFSRADAVLLDRKLPDGYAEELLPKLKAAATHAAFIVVTGYADMSAAIAALREGVSDFLIKPIDPDALRAGLDRLARNLATERELYRQRRFAEKLLDTAEAIVLVLDPAGRVLRANTYLLELTGYRLEEVIGASWIEQFIPDRQRAHVREIFARTVKQLKTRGIVNPIRCKDGSECEIRWSNATLRDASGTTTAVLAIGLDVTDFVRAQERLLQNERLAAIGETMTGLAHETRNALQRLQNSVNLLQRRFADDEIATKDLSKIERAGLHIRDLLEEVRAYAAPIVLSAARKPFPAAWRRAWQSLDHRKLHEVSMREHVPAEIEELIVAYDERRMEQVFRNLFENAIDAAVSNLTIEVTASCSEHELQVVVRDNGPGIAPSHRATVFDAFATSKPTGTGLGLAICKRIVEAHSGLIKLAESQLGAEFVLTIPIER